MNAPDEASAVKIVTDWLVALRIERLDGRPGSHGVVRTARISACREAGIWSATLRSARLSRPGWALWRASRTLSAQRGSVVWPAQRMDLTSRAALREGCRRWLLS